MKRTAALALSAAWIAGACALLPTEVGPRPGAPGVNVDPEGACLAIEGIVAERSLLRNAVLDALADKSTEALVAASSVRAHVATYVNKARVEYGDAMPDAVKNVAAIVSGQADVVDHGNVELTTRDELLTEGRSALEALDGHLQRMVGPGSLVARTCTHAEFNLRPFSFPEGP